MILGSLAGLLLKLIIGIIVIYLLAVFVVSFKKILPALAIISSVVTIIFLIKMRNSVVNFETLWLPVVCSVLTQFFYQGESFMEVKISQNVYKLVSIERKWNSLFADFDDYEFHYAPEETGGFFENAFFSTILYAIYYAAFDSAFVFVLPCYYLIMSILDFLIVVRLLPFSEILYTIFKWVMVFLSIIASIHIFVNNVGVNNNIDFSKPDTENPEVDPIYYSCCDLNNINLSRSYEICYKYSSKTLFGYKEEWDPVYFIYDFNINAGAQYIMNKKEKDYIKIFLESPNYDNQLVQYDKVNNNEYNFNKYVEMVDGPFKYSYIVDIYREYNEYEDGDYIFMWSTFDNVEGYKKLCELTLDKYKVIKKDYDKKKAILTLVYDTRKDKSFDEQLRNHYELDYKYKTDDEANPVELISINCSIEIGEKNKESLTFSPIYGQTNLKDILAEANLNESSNPENFDMFLPENLFSKFNGTYGTIKDYDFWMTENEHGSYVDYLYDLETKTVGLYYAHSQAISAEKYNAVNNYLPDYFVYTPTNSIYNSSKELIIQNDNDLYWGTLNNEFSSRAMLQVFNLPQSTLNSLEYNKNIHEEGAYISGEVFNDLLDTNITYEFVFNKGIDGKYNFKKVTVNFIIEEINYTMTVWGEDHYDVPNPTK